MWHKMIKDVPFKMAPLSSFTVTRRNLEVERESEEKVKQAVDMLQKSIQEELRKLLYGSDVIYDKTTSDFLSLSIVDHLKAQEFFDSIGTVKNVQIDEITGVMKADVHIHQSKPLFHWNVDKEVLKIHTHSHGIVEGGITCEPHFDLTPVPFEQKQFNGIL